MFYMIVVKLQINGIEVYECTNSNILNECPVHFNMYVNFQFCLSYFLICTNFMTQVVIMHFGESNFL